MKTTWWRNQARYSLVGMAAAATAWWPGVARAQVGAIDAQALDGVFGSSMGTALALAALILALAVAAVGLVGVGLRVTGRAESWDERKVPRGKDAGVWKDDERRRALASR